MPSDAAESADGTDRVGRCADCLVPLRETGDWAYDTDSGRYYCRQHAEEREGEPHAA